MHQTRKASTSSISKRKTSEETSADITSIARTLSNKSGKEDGGEKHAMEQIATKSIAGDPEQSTLDEWEPIDDDGHTDDGTHLSPKSQSKGKPRNSKKNISIRLPKSAKEIYKMFTLSTTNQILRGVSPTTGGSLSPRFPTPKEREQILEKEKEEKSKKNWMELIASEIYSARVNIIPPPREGDITRVARDPRSGRFDKKKRYGPPYGRLCKMVRKQLIRDIIHKHNLESAEPRIDTGLGKKLPTRKELKQWKLRRASGMEEWKKRKRKKRVVSTKKKRISAALRQCQCCGDYHFKRICGGLGDKRVNLLVKQIIQKADVIKQHMGEAWEKMDSMESMYQQMLLKVHRLQSNRVCLGKLTGKDYPGEEHPNNCPCSQQREKEDEDRKRMLERKRIEDEKRREQEEKRSIERGKRERIMDFKKKRFYSKLQPEVAQTQKAVVRLYGDAKVAGDTAGKVGELQDSFEDKIEEGYGHKTRLVTIMGDEDLTSLEEAKRPKADSSAVKTLMDDLGGIAKKSGILAQMESALKGTRFEELDLIVMDGEIKSVTTRLTEEGGIIHESMDVESLPELEEYLKEHFQEEEKEVEVEKEKEEEEEKDSELPLSARSQKSPAAESEKSIERPKSLTPFGEYLDIMEIF